jgi:hypothetical protein
MTQDMTGKIDFLFNDPQAQCDVVRCEGERNMRLVRFKGRFESFVICEDCIQSANLLLMMNEGV